MPWAGAVEDNETFAHLVEEDSGLKTLNAAISSYATAREIKMAERVDHSAVDLLVVQWSHNDDRENVAYLDAGNTLETGTEEAYLDAIAEADEKRSYYPFKHLVSAGNMLVDRFRPREPRAQNRPDGETDQDRTLQVLADLDLGDRKPALIMMELSNYGDYKIFKQRIDESEHLPALLEKFSSVHVYDADALLGGGDFLGGDGHTNASGHRKIADEIIATMDEVGLAAN